MDNEDPGAVSQAMINSIMRHFVSAERTAEPTTARLFNGEIGVVSAWLRTRRQSLRIGNWTRAATRLIESHDPIKHTISEGSRLINSLEPTLLLPGSLLSVSGHNAD